MEKYTDEETKGNIINDYLLQLIPAGTKGVIRGNRFNNIVKQRIANIKLDTARFEIYFEKKCELILLPRYLIGIFWKNLQTKLLSV